MLLKTSILRLLPTILMLLILLLLDTHTMHPHALHALSFCTRARLLLWWPIHSASTTPLTPHTCTRIWGIPGLLDIPLTPGLLLLWLLLLLLVILLLVLLLMLLLLIILLLLLVILLLLLVFLHVWVCSGEWSRSTITHVRARLHIAVSLPWLVEGWGSGISLGHHRDAHPNLEEWVLEAFVAAWSRFGLIQKHFLHQINSLR